MVKRLTGILPVNILIMMKTVFDYTLLRKAAETILNGAKRSLAEVIFATSKRKTKSRVWKYVGDYKDGEE